MLIKFDKFNRARKPNITLCNPNEDELFSLSSNNISNRNLTLRFNAISEFGFTAKEKYPDGTPCEFYDFLKTTRLVKIQDVGTFIITRVIEVDTGIYKSKDVECKSIEYEISQRSFTINEGTYKLYDPVNDKDTIMGMVMSLLPDWKIGSVDSDLWNIYRTFDVTEINLYDFLVSNVEEAYECIFIFNSMNRTISIKTPKNAVSETDIYVSHKNLVKEVKITEDADELKTALSVYGADDLSIRSVNPMGGTIIYDFSYYKNLDWMTQDMIEAVTAWENKLDTLSKSHKSNLLLLKSDSKKLLGLKTTLTEHQGELKTIENIKAVRLEQGLSISEINAEITAKENEIKQTEKQIKDVEKNIQNLKQAISLIAEQLAFENNFTEEQYKTLVRFIKSGTYQNDSFAITDIMTDVEEQEIVEELFELGKEVLNRVAQPKLSFEMEAINFLNLVGYEKFAKELQLGSEITYETRDKNRLAYPVLLEMSINYDDDKKITLGFGNRLRLDKSEYTFADLFKDTVNTVGDVNFNKGKWGEGVKANNKFNEYLNSSLNASLQEIISSDNQDILIDSSGIRCRRFNPNTGDFDPEQLWITGKSMVFTDDGFNTAKTAIGNIMLPDKTRAYGINAEVLLGKLIAGSQLQIFNEDMSFIVDANGVTLKNANLIITDEETGEDIALEDKVSNDLANVVDDINKQMGDMQEAIEDGMIEIFYQPRKPTASDGKNGDMWFDITLVDGRPKNEGYLKVKGSWVQIKDKGVLDALESAQNAQDTADGKITTYYTGTAPTKSTHPQLSEGDLWFDTSNKNKPYVYRSGSWRSVQDGTIKDAQDTANDALNKLDKVTDSNGNLITGALAGSILAGKNNIICQSSTTSNKVLINEKGILFSNSKDSSGNWVYKTAISASGIEAEAIRANGTLYGVNISGGTLNIGNGSFKVDSSGNVAITKGSININGGKFSVDSYGNVVAKSIKLTENVTGNVDANSLKIDNLVVGKNVTMGANATITWAQVTGKENVANKTDLIWSNISGKPNLATVDDLTWDRIKNRPTIPTVPSYITSTKITRTSIESPNIIGGVITGGILQSYVSGGAGIMIDSDSINWYYSGTSSCGSIFYDTGGAGTVEEARNRLLFKSTNGYALKIQSSGNMSLSAGGGHIYIGSVGGTVHLVGNVTGAIATFG